MLAWRVAVIEISFADSDKGLHLRQLISQQLLICQRTVKILAELLVPGSVPSTSSRGTQGGWLSLLQCSAQQMPATPRLLPGANGVLCCKKVSCRLLRRTFHHCACVCCFGQLHKEVSTEDLQEEFDGACIVGKGRSQSSLLTERPDNGRLSIFHSLSARLQHQIS